MPLAASAPLADQPFAVAAIVAFWCVCGLAVAAVLARRGHSFRHVGALGFVLGPLLIAFASPNLRWKEHQAKPVVLRQARPLGGSERALVALLGDPDELAGTRPVLRSIADRLHSVDVGVIVTFDEAEEEREDGGTASPSAIEALADAAACLEEFQPGLVLLPGRPADAVARYVESEGAAIVVVAGDTDVQAALCQDRTLRSLTILGSSHLTT